jgi:uncharacterized membrane protein (DUF106 family)
VFIPFITLLVTAFVLPLYFCLIFSRTLIDCLVLAVSKKLKKSVKEIAKKSMKERAKKRVKKKERKET